MENINFGLKINELIEARNISKVKAAQMMGYSRKGFSDAIDKEDVSTSILKRVCEVFNVDMSYFLGPANNIRQKGDANIAGSGNIQYKGKGNTIGADENKLQMLLNENEHLKEQLQGLKDQNTLLREMVEILKAKT